MLDGILGRKNFKTKCKSALARTRTRLEVIKRKRNAMQKFLKKDIAELLKSNLDLNAYGRVEGLFFELNLSSCYDYVDECCKWVAQHLKALHEQRECPEECKVAVSSLIYAAARFADLPELRDLRNQFNAKYGDLLGPHVSKEFVEKLKSKPPTMEMKLQLMEQVAHEFSIRWDPQSLEQQLQSPSIPTHNQGVDNGRNLSRSRSAKLQQKDKKEDYGVKQISEEYTTSTTGTKMRHTQSCSVVRGDVSYKIDELHSRKDSRILTPISSTTTNSDNATNTDPFTSRVVLAPYRVPEKTGTLTTWAEDQNQNLENGEPGSARKVRQRPKSVRTKFLKPSLSSASFYDHHEIDIRETLSARAPTREMSFDLPGDEGDELDNDVWTYFGKVSPKTLSPSSAKSVHSPTLPLILDHSESSNGKAVCELPLPPGRRRYFSDSQPNSPGKEEDASHKYEPLLSPGKSRFLPPDLEPPKSPAERKVSTTTTTTTTSRRHSRSSSQSEDPYAHVHPRMPNFDELAERIAILKQV